MTANLKTLLEIQYGDYLSQLENTFDWFERKKLIDKLNAICIILDIPEIPNANIYNKLKHFFL